MPFLPILRPYCRWTKFIFSRAYQRTNLTVYFWACNISRDIHFKGFFGPYGQLCIVKYSTVKTNHVTKLKTSDWLLRPQNSFKKSFLKKCYQFLQPKYILWKLCHKRRPHLLSQSQFSFTFQKCKYFGG